MVKNKKVQIMEYKLTKFGFDKWVEPSFAISTIPNQNWWYCKMNANNSLLELELADIATRKRLEVVARFDNGNICKKIYPYKYISSITHFKKWLKKEMKVF